MMAYLVLKLSKVVLENVDIKMNYDPKTRFLRQYYDSIRLKIQVVSPKIALISLPLTVMHVEASETRTLPDGGMQACKMPFQHFSD